MDRTAITSRLPGVVVALVVIALVAPFVVYAFPAVIGGNQSYVVLTGSMEPEISPGDAVVVKSVPTSEIAVGDVITFQTGTGEEIPVTHRVIEIAAGASGQPTFVTKGDANEDPDIAPVPAERVLGAVILTIPYIGFVVQFVNSPTGFVALVVLPLGLLLVTEVLRLVRPGDEESSDDAPAATATSEEATETVSESPDAIADSADVDDGAITLSPKDLTMTSGALGVLAAYAVYVGFTNEDPLSIAVAVGAATTVLLAVGIRQYGLEEAPRTPEEPRGATAAAAADGGVTTDDAAGFVPTVTVDPVHHDAPRVAMASLSDLVAVSETTGHPVVQSDRDGAYLLIDGEVVYEFRPGRADEPSRPDENRLADDEESVLEWHDPDSDANDPVSDANDLESDGRDSAAADSTDSTPGEGVTDGAPGADAVSREETNE